MRGSNFRDLIKDEMVNRFQDVITNEINEYREAKKETAIRISSLEIRLESICESLSSLKEQASEMYNNISDLFLKEKEKLQESFDEQRRFIRSNSDAIKSHIKESIEQSQSLISKEKFCVFAERIENEIKSIKLKNFDAKSETESNLHAIKEHIKLFVYQESDRCFKNTDFFLKVVEDYKNQIASLKVSNDGFVTELESCKKRIFVQQKNIENLYTQIEKLKVGKT